MRTAIVGNSENVLNNSFGHIIDNFDTVVRFNDFTTDGWESHVGSKTDFIWLSTPFLPLDTPDKYPEATILFYKKYIGYLNRKYRDRATPIPRFTRKNTKNKVWSNGLAVIDYFVKRGDDVTIHGIGDGGNGHYWNSTFKVFKKHDIRYEESRLEEFWPNINRIVDIG